MQAKNLRSGNNRPVVLFDFDDVVVDCLGGVIETWNREKGTNFKKEDVHTWDIDSCLGEGAFQLFFRKGFFENLKEKNGSIKVIDSLIHSTMYDLYIVTACQSVQEIEEKIKWLQSHIPNFNINRFIACKEKFMVRGDILIDDRASNLDSCRKYMDCILYDMPHNQDTRKYVRIESLEEVPEILNQLFYQ